MSYWNNKPNADEIAADLADALAVRHEAVQGIPLAAMKIAGKADEWCAIAYVNGYKEALDDCERADVAKLIEQIASLEGRLSFEKAQRTVAERKYEQAAANAAAVK